MAKKITYVSAMAELQEITRDLEDNRVPVDELAQRVGRARELLAWCRDKLRNTEAEVAKLYEEE